MSRGQATALPSVRVHRGHLAVVRLPPETPVPSWAGAPSPDAALHVLARTRSETSLVVADRLVPPDATAERGFRPLEVLGPLDFGLTGILAGLTAPLAAAGVPVFAVSTFDTDWLLVRDARLADALAALRAAGVQVDTEP